MLLPSHQRPKPKRYHPNKRLNNSQFGSYTIKRQQPIRLPTRRSRKRPYNRSTKHRPSPIRRTTSRANPNSNRRQNLYKFRSITKISKLINLPNLTHHKLHKPTINTRPTSATPQRHMRSTTRRRRRNPHSRLLPRIPIIIQRLTTKKRHYREPNNQGPLPLTRTRNLKIRRLPNRKFSRTMHANSNHTKHRRHRSHNNHQ